MKLGIRTGVAAAAGRRIDAAGAIEARFPSSAVPVVKQEVRRLLVEHEVGTLVASAACGADIVALEAALELGLQLVIVLPFEASRFRATSVVDRGGDWGTRFDALLAHEGAGREVISLAGADSDDTAYAEATRRIISEAEKRAPADASPLALVIWEGTPRVGTDATKAFMDQAAARGMKVRPIMTRLDEAAPR